MPQNHHLRGDGPVARRHRRGRHPQVERAHRQQARGDDELGPDAHGELGPEDRGDGHEGRDGEQPEAGGQRPVAFEELEVLGDEEDESREREEGDRDRCAGGGEAEVAEQAQVEHRLRGPPLPGDERARQYGDDREADERARAAPAVARRLDDRVDEQRHGRGREGEPGAVDPWGVRVARGGHVAGDEQAGEGGHRRHREEDAAPPESWSSQPPTIGPSAMAAPVIAPHSPMARARSPRSVKTLEISDSVEGNTIAEPTPITARAAISWPGLAVRPPATLARPKTASPARSMPLRPNRSERLPAARTDPAKSRLYASTTHCSWRVGRVQLAHEGRQRDVDDRRVDVDGERGQQQRGQDQRLAVSSLLLERAGRTRSDEVLNHLDKKIKLST